MKRLLFGAIAAVLAMGGLVVGSTTGAQAEPYPGTVKTFCKAEVQGNPRVGKPVIVVVKVTSQGNGKPKGRANVNADKKVGKGSASDSGSYDGGKLELSLGKLAKGKWTGTFNFNSKPADSVYKNCSDGFSFTVDPKR